MTKYRDFCCYKCGEPMRAATLSDVWDMRVDGKLHAIPVTNIPCNRCPACDVYTIDESSDAVVQYCYWKYVEENKLNTVWHKIGRMCRYVWRRIEWRLFNGVTYWRRKSKMVR
jgi:hypothetical protein